MSDFTEGLPSNSEYHLAEARLELTPDRAIFHARLQGPARAQVWARAWLSDESGTLSETATEALPAGETVAIAVPIPADLPAEGTILAAMRIESEPLRTEHVLMKTLRLNGGRLVA